MAVTLRGQVMKLKKALEDAGFRPYESWVVMGVKGTFGQSDGDYTLKPTYGDPTQYDLSVPSQYSEARIEALVKRESPKLGLLLEKRHGSGFTLRLENPPAVDPVVARKLYDEAVAAKKVWEKTYDSSDDKKLQAILKKLKTMGAADVANSAWLGRPFPPNLKIAFNKFNVPEILSQLMTALHAAGMDDTVKKLNQMGITRLVNDAWANRSMVDRLTGRYAMQKQAEAHDCWQDYKGGGMTYAELQECIEHFERLERGAYRQDYAAQAKWYENWAEIAELKGNESDAKFIRSVAGYVRRRSAPSPKQGEVLDRMRKQRYVEELKNPAATLQRLEAEKERREKDEAEAQRSFDQALRQLGGPQDHTKWNHWHSGQGEPEYPGYYYTDEGRPFFAQIEYNGWRGWRLTKLEIKEKNRNGRTLYTRTLSGGPDKLDDAMALATGMIRKFETGEDPTKPPTMKPTPVEHKPRVDMQFDDKAVEALEALATRTGNGMLKGMVALIKGGKNLTEDQLKAIRAQFHRTGQHSQAEMFRPKV